MKDKRLSRVWQSGEWPFSTDERPMVVLVMRSSEAHCTSILTRLLANGVQKDRMLLHARVHVCKSELPSTRVSYKYKYMRHGTKDSRKGPRFKWQLGRKSQDSRDDSGRRMTAWPGYLANPMSRLDGIRLSEER